MTDNIRLFLVEDQPAILKAQQKLMSSFADITLIGSAFSGEDALEAIKLLPTSMHPHVVLCDLGLPLMNGIEVTAELKKLNKKIEIIIFTVFEEEDKVLRAIKTGAAGYLLKGALATKIHEAIVDVFHGGTVIQPTLARRLLKHFSMPLQGTPNQVLEAEKRENKHLDTGALLTVRELECLQIISKGLSNNEAAGVLQLSKATIRTHLEHIYQKLDVSNRVEAVTEGIRQGIIEI
jgi:DNA-binding NarL/FixJ family response regulator